MNICGPFHGTYVAQELASQSIIWSCQGPMLLKGRPKGAHHEHHSAPHGPMLPKSRLKASIMSICGLFHGTHVAQEPASQSIIWSCQGPMLLKRRPKGAHHEHHSAPHGPMLPKSRLKASIMNICGPFHGTYVAQEPASHCIIWSSQAPCCSRRPKGAHHEHHSFGPSWPYVAQEQTEGEHHEHLWALSWDPCCPRASFSEHHLVLSGPCCSREDRRVRIMSIIRPLMALCCPRAD